jgi:hypothetical protein
MHVDTVSSAVRLERRSENDLCCLKSIQSHLNVPIASKANSLFMLSRSHMAANKEWLCCYGFCLVPSKSSLKP